MARLSAAELGLLACAALSGAGCARAPKEGPPAAESLEIASAAPGALGALAAGTEAAGALRVPVAPEPESPPEVFGDDDIEDGGARPGPDAAIESPEDIPL